MRIRLSSDCFRFAGERFVARLAGDKHTGCKKAATEEAESEEGDNHPERSDTCVAWQEAEAEEPAIEVECECFAASATRHSQARRQSWS